MRLPSKSPGERETAVKREKKSRRERNSTDLKIFDLTFSRFRSNREKRPNTLRELKRARTIPGFLEG